MVLYNFFFTYAAVLNIRSSFKSTFLCLAWQKFVWNVWLWFFVLFCERLIRFLSCVFGAERNHNVCPCAYLHYISSSLTPSETHTHAHTRTQQTHAPPLIPSREREVEVVRGRERERERESWMGTEEWGGPKEANESIGNSTTLPLRK